MAFRDGETAARKEPAMTLRTLSFASPALALAATLPFVAATILEPYARPLAVLIGMLIPAIQK